MKQRSTRAFLLTISISVFLVACNTEEAAEEKQEPIRLVRSTIIKEEPLTSPLQFSGEIKARYESQLGFRVNGKITQRLVDVGDSVKPGDTLFKLDAKDLKLAQEAATAGLNQARAERSLAKQNFERFKELKERGLVSSADFDRHATSLRSANEQVQVAVAQLDQAKNQKSYSVLKADQAGVITAVLAEVGQVVAAGQPVAQLERAGSLEVEFSVPEQQRDQIKADASASIHLWAEPDKTYNAVLREISPSADPLTRTYRARMEIENPDTALKPGMTANVALATSSRESLLLPLSALSTKSADPQVWRVNAENLTVQPVTVKTGDLLDNRIEIIEGIQSGERIVTAGANLLIPGQQVRIQEQQ